MTEAFIFDAVRTPRGRGRLDGSLHSITPISLATQVLKALRARNNLDTSKVDDVIMGCVSPVGDQGADIARTAVMMADYAQTTSGIQINRFCASGLDACNVAAAKVIAGEAEMAIGGGVESMSRLPINSDGGAWPLDPDVELKTYFAPQGIGADLIATLDGFSRADVDGYAVAIGKIPIVVNDSRGFYTSRCFGTYIYEGLEMLVEGITPALIENAGRMTGMPRGPLEISDDVAIDLSLRVIQQTKAVLGDAYETRPFVRVIEALVDAGRLGRKSGAGFYEYPAEKRKHLWSGLGELAPVTAGDAALVDVEWLKTRLLHRQALEAARCFHEGVIEDPREADVGAIMGWGFASWTGGPLSYIDGLGTERFVEECDELAAKLGSRFAVPDVLREMAARGDRYYSKSSKAAA